MGIIIYWFSPITGYNSLLHRAISNMNLYEGLSIWIALLSAVVTCMSYRMASKANNKADIALLQIQAIQMDNWVFISANSIENSWVIAHTTQ